MKTFHGPDGTAWAIEVLMPSHSSAMVVFRHPAGDTARFNRYAWVNAATPTAGDVRGRLTTDEVLTALDDRALARLFRRSMPISTDRPAYVVS